MTSNEASTAVTLGSDGSYGGMGTSDTDNDADSIHRFLMFFALLTSPFPNPVIII